MRVLLVAIASFVFGLVVGGAAAYVAGFYKSSDWDVILLGGAIASVLLWVAGALLLGSRKQQEAYLIFGGFSPLVGIPLAVYMSVIVEEGFGRGFSNLTGVLVWSPVFVGAGLLLMPFGILMGWIAGSVMAFPSSESAPKPPP